MQQVQMVPKFAWSLAAMITHLRGDEVATCTPVPEGTQSHDTMMHTMHTNDPADLMAHGHRLVKTLHYTATHYEVRAGADPDDLKLVGYLVYLRPARGDRARLPPTVLCLDMR